jgi:hypothetical protein
MTQSGDFTTLGWSAANIVRQFGVLRLRWLFIAATLGFFVAPLRCARACGSEEEFFSALLRHD